METQMTKEYQPSDCLLLNACRGFFRGKKHIDVCNKYISFICEQINGNEKYSEKLKEALSKERFILSRILLVERWNNLFKFIYGNIADGLRVIENRGVDRALDVFLLWHGFVYGSVEKVNI